MTHADFCQCPHCRLARKQRQARAAFCWSLAVLALCIAGVWMIAQGVLVGRLYNNNTPAAIGRTIRGR